MKAQVGGSWEGEDTTCFNFFSLNQKIHTCLYSKQSYSDTSQYEKSFNPKFRSERGLISNLLQDHQQHLLLVLKPGKASTTCWMLETDAGQQAGPPKDFKTKPSQKKNPQKNPNPRRDVTVHMEVSTFKDLLALWIKLHLKSFKIHAE